MVASNGALRPHRIADVRYLLLLGLIRNSPGRLRVIQLMTPGYMGFKSGDNLYDVGGEHFILPPAVAKIESVLSQSPVEPFFGSKPDYDVHILQRIFTDLGSSLRPVMVRRGQWSDVYVAKGTRQCILSSDLITCSEDSREFSTACITADDVVRIAIQFLEQQASLDELHIHSGRCSLSAVVIGYYERKIQRTRVDFSKSP